MSSNIIDIPTHIDLFEKGYNSGGQSPLEFTDSQKNEKTQSAFEAGVSSNFIKDGDLLVRLNMIDGYLQSSNFVTGSSGWQIKEDGTVEFCTGTFRGTLTAASGTLGSITIGTNAWHVDSEGNMWWGNFSSYAAATIKISSAGSVNFTTGDFSGTLSAASGTLGTITAGTITGALVQSAATGYRVKFSSSGLQFLSNNDVKGSIGTDAIGSMVLYSYDNFYFRDNNTELVRMTGDGIIIPNDSAYYITSGVKMSYLSGYFKIEGGSGGDVGVRIQGTIYPNSDNTYDLGDGSYRWRKGYFEDIQVDDIFINDSLTILGTNINGSATDDSYAFVTSLRYDSGNYQFKYRVVYLKMGIVYNVGGESGWQTIS